MVQLWFPKDELKADLEEQAKRRLEEITRAAAQRRDEITAQAQSTLDDERLQSVLGRFNSLVDPLIAKGREGIDGATSMVQDNAARAQQLVEEANRSLQQSPSLIPEPGQPTPPSAFAPSPATPPPPPPSPEPQTPPSQTPGISGQPYTPEPPLSPAPDIAAPEMPSPIMPTPGGPFGGPPGGPPPFRPPGMQGLGQGLGDALGGIGDKVTQGRDQAMELASKSLDVAREAVSGGQQQAGQLGTWRDAQMQRPARDVLADTQRAATGLFAGFREQQAQARQAALTDTSQADWEARQGLERSDADVSGGPVVRALEGLEGAARGWEKSRRMGEEQFRTAMGYGTQGEDFGQQLQAGFGAGMGPYGVLPEIARGGVENLTGNPLAGAAAYGAASILGPGGPRAFLQEGLPTAARIAREGPRAVAAAEGFIPTARAASAGLGVAGAPIAGGVTGALALREGKSPQEAAAEGLTTAADVVQLAEMADLPIAAADRVLRALPNLPGMGRFLPPGLRPPPRPALPGEPGTNLPDVERAPEERPLDEEGLRPEELDGALEGRTPEALAAAAAARVRREADFGSDVDAANRSLLAPLAPGESTAAAQQRVGEEARAAGQMEEATGSLGERLRRALGAAGQELGPDQSRLGVTFGNAPTTVPGAAGRRVGAIEQTLDGERVTVPETQIDLAGRRAQPGFPVDPQTRLLQGTIEDRLAKAYRERDLTVEEEDALGLGMPGQEGERLYGKASGLNRLLGFRHPGWMAKDYAPDLETGVMRYRIPDLANLPEGWDTYQRFGKSGESGTRYRKVERGRFMDEGEGEGAGAGEKATGGAKVILSGRPTGDGRADAALEVKPADLPDAAWKSAQTPITVKEGMARDGSVESQATTPLSYHRMALVRGLGLRNFYPNFGQIFRDDLARGSSPLMHELNAIYGATASQASPETNLQRTLAVMTAGRWFRNTYPELNRPPTVDELAVLTASKPGERLRHNQWVTDQMEGMFSAGGITTADLAKVVKIWKTGRADIGAGWKTPVFYQNILTSARNLIDRLSVPDTHMFRGRGYTMTGGSAPATVNQDLRALGITNATVTQLADEFGLNPKQVQSALWFDYKENLAPFNATDKARIKAKAGGAEEGSPAWLEQARTHDPWPTTEIRTKPKLDAEGNALLKEDGTPQYETARQGTIDSVMQHVAGVNPGKHAKALEDAEYTARGEATPAKSRGKTKKAYRRFDLLQAFRDQDKAFSERFGQDALTPESEQAALTFNGRAVGNPVWEGAKPNVQGVTIPYEAQEGMAQRMRRGVPSMEITPEAMERAAFKLGQEAPVVVVPVDSVDGEALSRLGYDEATGQIDVLRQESIPHEVILENRPFTVGAPGEATPRETIHVLFPGASLDTARYGAAILGQRSGADEVAITWPTGEGQGRPVVAIDHPEGGQWTEGEIARFPWAQKLVGRANLSPDGRTFYFADFGADRSGVPFGERVQAILDDAMTPEEQQALVHRSADFGAERVGGESFAPLVNQGTLVGGGPLGEEAMARAFPGLEGGTPRNRPYAEWAEGGENIPGARPGAVNLREYAGPEGFRAPGAARGSLGIAAGMGMGRRGDLLDEGLQAGQTVAGGLMGTQWADPGEEEDPLRRRLKQAGGFLLGAEMGARAANPRRLMRAAQAFSREMGGAAAAGRGLRAAGEALGTDGRLGAVAGGPPTGPVPERGKQGEDVGLGDLDDPENLAQQILNPPEGGWQGAQQQELIRAMARRVKNPEVSAPGAKAEQVEAERGRRLERRHEAREEAQDKVKRARGPEETGDAAADAEDAARRGEIGQNDADSVRGQAARKLQAQKGDDGAPPPGEMDKQIEASRRRRGVKAPEEAPPGPVEGAAEQTVRRVREGLRRLPEQAPPGKGELVGPRAEGMSPEALARQQAGPPEGTAVARGEPQTRQLEMGADLAPGRPTPEPLPEQRPPSGRELVGERAPGASLEGEPTAPETAVVQGEPGPESLQLELPGSRTEMAGAARPVGGETEAERLDREAREAPGRARAQEEATAGNVGALQRQFEGTAEQIPLARGAPEPGVARVAEEPGPRRAVLPGLERQAGEGTLTPAGGETDIERADRLAREAEARAKGLREAGERALPPAERRAPEEEQTGFEGLLGPGISFAVGKDGNPLTRQQIAERVAGRLGTPGGWAAAREEWGNLLPDAGKALLAGMKGVPLVPGQIEKALRGGKGPGSWEQMSNKQRENIAALRPEHFWDSISTMSRLNLVVNPESIVRNVFSTSVGLPFRFFEATTGPIFEGFWSSIPRPRPGADGTVKWSRRGSDAPSDPAEVVAMGEGMLRSMGAAFANVAGVLRRGDVGATQRQLDQPTTGAFHETRLGKAMGNAFRPLTAGDAFFTTLNEGMEAYRLAYRQAKGEFDAGKLGAEPTKIRSRMMEIMQSPTPKFLSQVNQAGKYNTFNQQAGFLATRLESWKNWDAGGHPAAAAMWRLGMNFLVPFVRISTNVMKYGFERSIPGGLLSVAHGAVTGKSDYEMGQRTARLAEGAMLSAALTSLQQSGAVEITGALPQDESEREEWQLQGKTPFSIRVGDRWYNPGAFPGLNEAVVLAGLQGDIERGEADAEARGEAYQMGDRARAAMRATLGYIGQTGIRPMFGSVTNLLNAAMSPEPSEQDYYLDQLMRSAAGQLAPASGTMRAIGNITDPSQRQPGRLSLQDHLAQIYPWWRENLPERTNALGEVMESEGYGNWAAGLTSSRLARDEELPRRYLGSESAREDLQISRAIKRVQDYARDPAGYEPPTSEERALAARFGKRENKARQALDKRVDAAARRAALERTYDQEAGYEDLFRFRAPTGIVEAPMRFEDYMRSYGGAS